MPIQETAIIKVSVMCPNKPGVRFDHDYYRNKHLPLIKSRMGAALKYYTIDKGLAERTAARRSARSTAVRILDAARHVTKWTSRVLSRLRSTWYHQIGGGPGTEDAHQEAHLHSRPGSEAGARPADGRH